MTETTGATTDPIGVGIVGLNASRGWASLAHLPALAALPEFEVRGAAGSTRESGSATAAQLGLPRAFASGAELVRDRSIDLVVVTVRAPLHEGIVLDALDAGKSVYCEWPLGASAEAAEAMGRSAVRHGARTVVGLQARQAPPVRYVRDLIADGYVGEVLSTTVFGSSSRGDVVTAGNEYMLEPSSGANLSTVSFGHTLDTVTQVLGNVAELSTVTATRRPALSRTDGVPLVNATSDQLAVIGALEGGATFVMHLGERMNAPTGFTWQINGSAGTLRISGSEAVPEIVPLEVVGRRGDNPMMALPIPASYRSDRPPVEALAGTPAYNVARTYLAFADSGRTGSDGPAGFVEANRLHHTVTAIAAAARSGQRQHL